MTTSGTYFFCPLQDIRREIFIVTFFREPTRFPKVQLLPFYIPFLTEKNLVQNFASLLATVNALSNPEIFLVFLTAIKSAC